MKILYAPWRHSYSTKLKKGLKGALQSSACPFCFQATENQDDTYFIIKRYKYNYVCMNKHPYNAGHLLIIPYKHEKDFTKLPLETLTELMHITQKAVAALQSACQATDFNIGFNIGKAAGGSIPDHLHMHILPRFGSDTGFLSVLAHTKVISVDIHSLFKILRETFK